MVDVPDFGFDAMSHQQLVDLVREAPPGDVNAPVAERLTRIAAALNESIERIQAAMTGGTTTWTGAAAQAAGELVGRMREFSAEATEQAAFFTTQATHQIDGAQWVKTTMPLAVPNPLAQAPDFGNAGLVGLTEPMYLKEGAAAEAHSLARQVMHQWAADTAGRVDQMSIVDPLPSAPGPNAATTAQRTGSPSTAQPVAAPSPAVQAQGFGMVVPSGSPTGEREPGRAPGKAGEPVRANPGVPRLATESVRGGHPGEDDKERRKRYSVESDEYFDVDADSDGVVRDPGDEGKSVAPPVIGER